MRITTEFECGGGKRLACLGGNRWRVEASGDASGYNKYVCLSIETGPAEADPWLELEIAPDADLGAAGAAFFRSHFPSHLWCCADDWDPWWPLRNRWEDGLRFGEDAIRVRIPLESGRRLLLATNPPLRYSDLLAWIDRAGQRPGAAVARESLGESAEGREIPVLLLPGPSRGLPRLAVLAGQHPSEHCGCWAARGIVEYVLSSIAEAREITDHFDLAVIPMVNPDGNVRGLSGANAGGVNLFSDYPGPPGAPMPQAVESRRLWHWLTERFPPDALLHFHGYMGWRAFAQPPYDGAYRIGAAETLYAPERRAAYEAIQERLTFETPAPTATGGFGWLDEATLEHHLAARLGTLSAFYEINSASVGTVEQYRRGPQVLAAVARALVRDHPLG